MDEYKNNHLKQIQGFLTYYNSYIDSALNGHVTDKDLADLLTKMEFSISNGFLDDIKELSAYLYNQADQKGDFSHE